MAVNSVSRNSHCRSHDVWIDWYTTSIWPSELRKYLVGVAVKEYQANRNVNPLKMIKNQFSQGLPSRARVHSNNRTCKYFLTYNYSSLLSRIGTIKTVTGRTVSRTARSGLACFLENKLTLINWSVIFAKSKLSNEFPTVYTVFEN